MLVSDHVVPLVGVAALADLAVLVGGEGVVDATLRRGSGLAVVPRVVEVPLGLDELDGNDEGIEDGSPAGAAGRTAVGS